MNISGNNYNRDGNLLKIEGNMVGDNQWTCIASNEINGKTFQVSRQIKFKAGELHLIIFTLFTLKIKVFQIWWFYRGWRWSLVAKSNYDGYALLEGMDDSSTNITHKIWEQQWSGEMSLSNQFKSMSM